MSPPRVPGAGAAAASAGGLRADAAGVPGAGDAAAAPVFSSVEAPDLVDLVEAQLTRAIAEGRLAPGARVVESEISRAMGVSRAPVREAARRLESQGILVARPRRGFVVRTVTAQEVDDLYAVRQELELLAVRLACAHATDAELAELAAHTDTMIARAGHVALSERVALDMALHMRVCELSGNRYLQRLFANMQTELRMMVAVNEGVNHDGRFVAQTHLPVIEALVRRDAAAAEAALRQHIDDGRCHVRAVFDAA